MARRRMNPSWSLPTSIDVWQCDAKLMNDDDDDDDADANDANDADADVVDADAANDEGASFEGDGHAFTWGFRFFRGLMVLTTFVVGPREIVTVLLLSTTIVFRLFGGIAVASSSSSFMLSFTQTDCCRC